MQGVSLITDTNGIPAVLTIDLRTLDPDNHALVAGLLERVQQEAGESERADWRQLAHSILNRSYGDDEPDYSNVPMIQELDLVALLIDRPALGLGRGDVGTVVHIYNGRNVYEVEFINAKGVTVTVESLTVDEIQTVDPARVMLHYSDLP